MLHHKLYPVHAAGTELPHSHESNTHEIQAFCSLHSLANYVNTKMNLSSYSRLGSPLSCTELLRLQGKFFYDVPPYVVAPHGSWRVTKRPKPLSSLQCSDARWSRLFTRKPRAKRLQV